MTNLINRIEALEIKQENGTVTMEEEDLLQKLVKLFEGYVSQR